MVVHMCAITSWLRIDAGLASLPPVGIRGFSKQWRISSQSHPRSPDGSNTVFGFQCNERYLQWDDSATVSNAVPMSRTTTNQPYEQTQYFLSFRSAN